MRALRRFTVRATLPPELAALGELVLNLRWSWHPETRDLFQSVDPELWRACGRDPVRLLGAVSAARLAELAGDRRFLRRLAAAADDLRRLPDRAAAGTRRRTPASPPRDRLLLARVRHHRRAAAVLRRPRHPGRRPPQGGQRPRRAAHRRRAALPARLLPPVAVPATAGSRSTTRPRPERAAAGAAPGADGTALQVAARPARRPAAARPGLAGAGRPGAAAAARLRRRGERRRPSASVTDRLYGGGSEHRLLQEMLLGIGGVRAVRAYCRADRHAGARGVPHQRGPRRLPRPRAHPRAGRRRGLDLRRGAGGGARRHRVHHAHARARRHRPLRPASWSPALRRRPRAAPACPVDRVLELGAEDSERRPGVFNMAVMGLRLAQRANGVSHAARRGQPGDVRRAVAGLRPGRGADHLGHQRRARPDLGGPRASLELADARRSHERLQPAARAGTPSTRSPTRTSGRLRRTLREQLVDEVRGRLRASWRQRGAGAAELGWIDGVLDPDVLTDRLRPPGARRTSGSR